jgi:hypothetical protein|tara:strand:+ start:345 stop:596 length:252 start_codon:yes stop_codon:yes gene_type:complete
LHLLLTDATGSKIVQGGTQRVDTRWGQKLIRQIDAEIVNSKLITEPISDLIIPWQNLNVPSIQLIRNDSTHHPSNGQISGISL